MSSPRRTREERQQELLPHLYRLLSEHGLEAANLRLLARETATSARMLHYYFEGAEGLVHAVIEYERHQQRAQLTALAGAAREQVRLWVHDAVRVIIREAFGEGP